MNQLSVEELEALIIEHSTYVNGECGSCGLMIGMLPHDNPIPFHQADVIYEAVYGDQMT